MQSKLIGAYCCVRVRVHCCTLLHDKVSSSTFIGSMARFTGFAGFKFKVCRMPCYAAAADVNMDSKRVAKTRIAVVQISFYFSTAPHFMLRCFVRRCAAVN